VLICFETLVSHMQLIRATQVDPEQVGDTLSQVSRPKVCKWYHEWRQFLYPVGGIYGVVPRMYNLKAGGLHQGTGRHTKY
jgi:hypothetical protein